MRACDDFSKRSVKQRGILLTHGHLDRILNAATIARQHGAWIAGPPADLDRYPGRPKCHGLNRIAGGLERMGRSVLCFQPFTPDQSVEEGGGFPVLGGSGPFTFPAIRQGIAATFANRAVCFSAAISSRAMDSCPIDRLLFSMRIRLRRARRSRKRSHWIRAESCLIIACKALRNGILNA